MQKKLLKYFSLGFFIFFIDRLSKCIALSWCAQVPCIISPFLSCALYFNRGISWGVFHSESDYLFAGVSLIITMITLLIFWYAYCRYMQGHSIIGPLCVIVGSFSNLIDRVVYGGVIDFIVFSYHGWSWPVFNIADVVIVLGVALMFLQNEK